MKQPLMFKFSNQCVSFPLTEEGSGICWVKMIGRVNLLFIFILNLMPLIFPFGLCKIFFSLLDAISFIGCKYSAFYNLLIHLKLINSLSYLQIFVDVHSFFDITSVLMFSNCGFRTSSWTH
jgi:hypothetical protein